MKRLEAPRQPCSSQGALSPQREHNKPGMEKGHSVCPQTDIYMVFPEHIFIFKVLRDSGSLPGGSIARNYSPALCRKRLPPHYLVSQRQQVLASSLPHSAAGALFLARQWPVQLSPVPGGITDPQTVQTTTSAWNQAKGNGALEELFRMHSKQGSNILPAGTWQQSCKGHTVASSCTIFGESSFIHPEKHKTPQQKK